MRCERIHASSGCTDPGRLKPELRTHELMCASLEFSLQAALHPGRLKPELRTIRVIRVLTQTVALCNRGITILLILLSCPPSYPAILSHSRNEVWLSRSCGRTGKKRRDRFIRRP